MKNLHTSKQAYLGEWKRSLGPNLHIARSLKSILIVRGWQHDHFFFFKHSSGYKNKDQVGTASNHRQWSLNLNFNLWKCTY